MKVYKYSCFVFCFFSVLFLFVIAIINYFIDGGKQFHRAEKIEQKIFQSLQQGRPLLVNTNYNDRIIQKYMLQDIKSDITTLVLGSSHSLPLSSHALNESHLYNASVSGGHLEDHIALYYILEKRGVDINTVLICIDPWLINRKFASLLTGDSLELWKASLAAEYFSAKEAFSGLHVNRIQIWGIKIFSIFQKYSQLLTLDYLRASFRQIIYFLQNRNNQPVVIEFSRSNGYSNCNVKFPDGSLAPSQDSEALTEKEVNKITNKLLILVATFYQEFDAIDEKLKNDFELFVQHLLSKKIKVIFFFPPFQPMAYEKLIKNNTNYNSLIHVEKYYLSFAHRHNIPIIGAYDSTKLGLKNDDFVDMWHLKSKGVEKIFLSKNHTSILQVANA